MKKISGSFDFSKILEEGFNIKIDGGYEYSDKKIYIGYIGDAYINEFDYVDAKKIGNLYYIYDENLTQVLKGLYTIVIFDKITQKIILLQDLFSNTQSLYFTKFKEKFFFDTSLKSLLYNSKIPRKINLGSVDKFIKNGFLEDENTLIEKVNKLPAGKKVIYNLYTGLCSFKNINLKFNNIDENLAKKYYIPIFENILDNLLPKSSNINITISSGFDSNFILYSTKKLRSLEINAFCVGGNNGIDESIIANKIVNHYDNVRFKKILVNSKTLDCFPDIVWRLEDTVYERGIFLQYALAKELNKLGISTLVCGECADQVLNKNFYSNSCENEIFNWDDNPYEMASYLVLKKNGKISNSFSIDVKYPYLNKDFIDIAYSLKHINKLDKKFHKEILKTKLNPYVYNMLSKIGGSTDLCALFDEDTKFKKLYKFISKSKFYNEEQNYYHRYSVEETKKDYCLKILYILLFEKLFISEYFDANFEKENIERTLEEFLNL